jgi:leucyl-tRNA synthetase
MPQWAGSCWYYLRYIDPKNDRQFVDPEKERYWMNSQAGTDKEPANTLRQAPNGGVDLYIGGVEHAVLHLLYARFWHKVLYDLGDVSTPEPFGRLFNQGYIQAYCYRDSRGIAVPAEEVVDQNGKAAMDVQDQPGRQFTYQGQAVTQEYGKMGKSLKNAVNPNDVCKEYGCDTLRLYEMYMGPLEASKPWNTRDITGVHRFLQRFWRNIFHVETGEFLVTNDAPDDELLRLLHKTIARVTDEMERLSFNTAIAGLIELNNALVPRDTVPRAIAEPFVLMLAPLAPHICEEIWQRLGHEGSIAYKAWPKFDPAMVRDEEVELAIQILGKVRDRMTVPADSDEETIKQKALETEKIKPLLEGKTVRKVIVIKDRLVNIVAN